MNNKRMKHWSTIVFFGALWGIVEATLGYLLHLVPAMIAGTILFPFAMTILFLTYRQTQSLGSLLGVGLVAAMIKAVNFLFPFMNAWKIINPIVMILMESLVVLVVVKAIVPAKWPTKLVLITSASVLWRVTYLGYMFVQKALTGFVAAQIATLSAMAEFAVFAGLISASIACVLFAITELSQKTSALRITPSFVLSLGAFSIAVGLTILL